MGKTYLQSRHKANMDFRNSAVGLSVYIQHRMIIGAIRKTKTSKGTFKLGRRVREEISFEVTKCKARLVFHPNPLVRRPLQQPNDSRLKILECK